MKDWKLYEIFYEWYCGYGCCGHEDSTVIQAEDESQALSLFMHNRKDVWIGDVEVKPYNYTPSYEIKVNTRLQNPKIIW